MRTASTTIAAGLFSLLMAGAAAADSTVPGDPGGSRRDPTPAATPSLAPNPGQQRPTHAAAMAHLPPAPKAALDPSAGADAAVDAALGVLPQGSAAAEGAKHIYVTEDGELGCVTLDTFFPEDC